MACGRDRCFCCALSKLGASSVSWNSLYCRSAPSWARLPTRQKRDGSSCWSWGGVLLSAAPRASLSPGAVLIMSAMSSQESSSLTTSSPGAKGLRDRASVRGLEARGRNVDELEIEEQNSLYPAVNGSVGLKVRIVQRALYVLGVHLHREVLDAYWILTFSSAEALGTSREALVSVVSNGIRARTWVWSRTWPKALVPARRFAIESFPPLPCSNRPTG